MYTVDKGYAFGCPSNNKVKSEEFITLPTYKPSV